VARAERALGAMIAAIAVLACVPSAQAAIPSIPSSHDGTGAPIPCTVQPAGPDEGERWCGAAADAIFTTFDGAPIDIAVGFPPAPASGPDGDFPVVGIFHGWGGNKGGQTPDKAIAQQWLDKGYAVFTMSDRGWGRSCGGQDPKRLTPVCADGYNHLMDTRYEVRDAQEVFEALADQQATPGPAGTGLIDPRRIGAMGGSYGGGVSIALAALKNRKMIGGESPDPVNGTLVPWVSDGGKEMRIAASQPDITWTDLAYSLQPNGATLDYVADAPYLGPNGDRRIGVLKQSFVAGLFGTGAASSNYAPPGADPDANLIQWYAEVNAGDPYDENPLAADLIDELTRHHSSYYIDDTIAPAPLLISNGWTDDLFPPDEAIRFYNRTRVRHPGTPIALMFSSHGHQRGQAKTPDRDWRNSQLRDWFDHYVKGTGPRPFEGVQAITTTCPNAEPSGGATGAFADPATDRPFRAPTWAEIAPGEVRYESTESKTIQPGATDRAAQAFDPIAGGGACATAPGADQNGTASYRLDPAPAGGFTVMGSPTVIARISSASPTSQVAARLLDVGPDGNERLIARGLYRPAPQAGETRQVFQLHPNGWSVPEGHVVKLELLPADTPYGRASNGQAPVSISNLELRLPVVERPGGCPVQREAPKVVPEGYALAPDYAGGRRVPPCQIDAGPDAGPKGSCTDFNKIKGTRKRDKLRGTRRADSLTGRGGRDRIKARAGSDCASGGKGRDRVSGGGGDDKLTGGAGNDVIKAGGGSDIVNCGAGRRDRAVVGRSDSVSGCEKIRRRGS
jgi:predicted acyl esterase